MQKSQQIKLEIDMESVPYARPRFGNGHFFNPAKYKNFRIKLAWLARQQYSDPPLTGPLKIRITLRRPIAITKVAWGDLDNHIKSILDSLTGICYEDDRQVVWIQCVKKFGAPHIKIEIKSVEDKNEIFISDRKT